MGKGLDDTFDDKIGLAVAIRKKYLTVKELDALIEDAQRISPKAQLSTNDEWRTLGENEIVQEGDMVHSLRLTNEMIGIVGRTVEYLMNRKHNAITKITRKEKR